VASQFVAHNLVNEYLVYLAPMLLGGPNTALQDIGVASMPQAKDLQINETYKLGNDLLIVAAPKPTTESSN
jgi:diaminohydroxyphosphoribosylaminopyrimidine deaminase/5-amino-6-(5-phosphoribosylamino)uracil reductase